MTSTESISTEPTSTIECYDLGISTDEYHRMIAAMADTQASHRSGRSGLAEVIDFPIRNITGPTRGPFAMPAAS